MINYLTCVFWTSPKSNLSTGTGMGSPSNADNDSFYHVKKTNSDSSQLKSRVIPLIIYYMFMTYPAANSYKQILAKRKKLSPDWSGYLDSVGKLGCYAADGDW